MVMQASLVVDGPGLPEEALKQLSLVFDDFGQVGWKCIVVDSLEHIAVPDSEQERTEHVEAFLDSDPEEEPTAGGLVVPLEQNMAVEPQEKPPSHLK